MSEPTRGRSCCVEPHEGTFVRDQHTLHLTVDGSEMLSPPPSGAEVSCPGQVFRDTWQVDILAIDLVEKKMK